MWYWSMTPIYLNNEDIVFMFVSTSSLVFANLNVGFTIRPVINVTTNNGFTSGDGTASNPYIIN